MTLCPCQRGDLTVRFNSALIRHFDEMTAAARGERADQVLDTRPTAMFAGNAEGKAARSLTWTRSQTKLHQT